MRPDATSPSHSPFLGLPEAEWLCANELVFAIFDSFPVSPGHVNVIPRYAGDGPVPHELVYRDNRLRNARSLGQPLHSRPVDAVKPESVRRCLHYGKNRSPETGHLGCGDNA